MSAPFEHLGYFETVIDVLTGRVLGNRLNVTPRKGRLIGFNGQEEETYTSDVVLNRGAKNIVVKATPTKPVKVRTLVFPISGRTTWKHPLDPK